MFGKKLGSKTFCQLACIHGIHIFGTFLIPITLDGACNALLVKNKYMFDYQHLIKGRFKL